MRGVAGGGKLWEPTNGELNDEETRWDGLLLEKVVEDRRFGLENRFLGDFKEKKESE